MKSRFWLVAGMGIIMILSACTFKPADPLDATGWILTELNGQSVLVDPLVTLNFASGNLSGTDGCNHYSGTYSVSGNRFSAGKEILSTLMACEESIMQQASAYMAALTGAVKYEIKGSNLSLLDESGAALAVFSAQSRELAGTSWIVTGFNNGQQAVVSPIPDTKLTLTFDRDGKFSGSAGCNHYFGSLTIGKGDTLQISELGNSAMACLSPQNLMEQEAQFLQALRSIAAYRMDGNSLEFRTADDQIAVTLVKVP